MINICLSNLCMTACNKTSLVYSHQARNRVTNIEHSTDKSRKDLKITKKKIEKIICMLKDSLIEEGKLQSKIRGLYSCLEANVKTGHVLQRKQFEEKEREKRGRNADVLN